MRRVDRDMLKRAADGYQAAASMLWDLVDAKDLPAIDQVEGTLHRSRVIAGEGERCSTHVIKDIGDDPAPVA